jgi:uncharacterized protein YuzB (UPF0349 family)
MENICISGGAEGADTIWGQWAKKNDYNVIHYSFNKHNSKCNKNDICILNDEQLKMADDFLLRANKSLKRMWPTYNPYVANLLRRNWYQVNETRSVYAVGKFVHGRIDGGTAWAIQMYLDRFLIDGENIKQCFAFFFDQELNRWFKFNAKEQIWEKLSDMPPKPSGIWTGIGTRQLNEKGYQAIENLMNRYPFPIQENPETGKIIYLPDDRKDNLILNGGWATIAAIQTAINISGERMNFVFIQEYGGTICYHWEDKLKNHQRKLREQYGLNRAYVKSN